MQAARGETLNPSLLTIRRADSNPGGSNPAIRTLFYRLVRLLGLAIHPIFVFDGPNKPTFKRNKRSGRGDGVATAMAKRLIRLFGFAIHDAPGEAEAECALLEQQGVVDAVLSEDVDTIMFGCRRTLRNWTAEGTKGSKTPTHVSLHDAAAVAAGTSGLDREGMVLVALMSGGDYLPEGVPGCGVKVACEAARAGFGRDLCRIKRADTDALKAWKERLLHELRTNESGFFRTRHKALDIPESFPNTEVLRYYTHPVVSRQTTVDRLKRQFPPASAVDVVGLRDFAGETFDWAFRIGAVKLIRVLAPSLLVQLFLDRYVSAKGHHDDLVLKQKEEAALVGAISSRRAHFSTDATPELRISFIPSTIVTLDLDAEPEEEVEAFGRSGIALNSDDEFDEAAEETTGEKSKTGSSRKPYDPSQPELVWIPETIAKLAIPLTVEDWEAKQRAKEQRVAAKGSRKTKAKTTDMPVGALDKYVKVTKNVENTSKQPTSHEPSLPPRNTSTQETLLPPRGRTRQPKKSTTTTQTNKPPANVNPWTLTNSQASPKVTKSSSFSEQGKSGSSLKPILIESSPVSAVKPSAPVTNSGYQTTPTKAKWFQSPPGDICSSPPSLFGTSPSPARQRSSARGQQPEPVIKPRPFRRVKSGDKPAGAVPGQKSIKDYGRVLRNVGSSQPSTKAGPVPVKAASDDDDFDFPLPRFKPPPPSSPFSQDGTLNPASNLAIDDDPFGPPSPEFRHPPSPGLPPLSTESHQASPSSPLAEIEPKHFNHSFQTKTTESVNSATQPSPPKSTTTTTAKSATASSLKGTTKLFIPRESLDGLGYYTEIEVTREEADAMTAAAAAARNGDATKPGRRARTWRLSEVEVLDLTGED